MHRCTDAGLATGRDAAPAWRTTATPVETGGGPQGETRVPGRRHDRHRLAVPAHHGSGAGHRRLRHVPGLARRGRPQSPAARLRPGHASTRSLLTHAHLDHCGMLPVRGAGGLPRARSTPRGPRRSWRAWCCSTPARCRPSRHGTIAERAERLMRRRGLGATAITSPRMARCYDPEAALRGQPAGARDHRPRAALRRGRRGGGGRALPPRRVRRCPSRVRRA